MLFGWTRGRDLPWLLKGNQRLLGVEELDLEPPAENWWEAGRSAESRVWFMLFLNCTLRRLLRHSKESSHFMLRSSWMHGPSPSGPDIKLPAGSAVCDP